MHLEARHRGKAAAWQLALVEWPGLALKGALRRGDLRRAKWTGRSAGMLAWMRGHKATDIGLG